MQTDHAAALKQLRRFIDEIHPLDEQTWSDFADLWSPFSAKRKTVLTAEGARERYLYFVLDGVQRAYAVDDAGREATLVFTYPPSFAGVADALLLQTPSRYFFETLTPSSFLRADFQRLDELMLRSHAVERMVRLALSHALAGVLARQIELQSADAEQRFRALLARSPHLLQLAPHKYIANYLGMDATNFSKFLGSIRL